MIHWELIAGSGVVPIISLACLLIGWADYIPDGIDFGHVIKERCDQVSELPLDGSFDKNQPFRPINYHSKKVANINTVLYYTILLTREGPSSI